MYSNNICQRYGTVTPIIILRLEAIKMSKGDAGNSTDDATEIFWHGFANTS